MDFSRLPEPAFLHIFEYLHLEGCIRAGRVNKMFHRIAQLAISHTKYLDLTKGRFRKLTSDQLGIILNLCSPNLDCIKFGGGYITENVHYRQLATTFAQYECPRMIDIDLGYTPINHAVFEQLIRNSPNIESLVWRAIFVGFPPITNNKLKKLHLNVYNIASLQTLIGRYPNLEEIILSVGNVPGAVAVLDEFFASVPRVQRIDMDLYTVDSTVFVTQLVSFWNLELTSLKVSCFYRTLPGDSLLYKVVTSFPHLQELRLSELEPTNAGISWLGVLQELQVLQLTFSNAGKTYDQGIRQLSRCQKLRKLDLYRSNMTGGTLIYLLRSCSQLENVSIVDITEVECPEEAVVVLDSLAAIPMRDITIWFHWKSGTFESIWKGESTKAAIKKLEENDGLKIRFI